MLVGAYSGSLSTQVLAFYLMELRKHGTGLVLSAVTSMFAAS